MSSKTQTKTDQIISYFIYGIGVQIIVFSLCSVWLTYIPTPGVIFLQHTYLYSLYLIDKIPSLLAKSDPNTNVKLPEIVQHIQRKWFSSVSPMLHAPKYLLALIMLYHFPPMLGLLVTYIILSLSYGIEETETLLNIPMIALSSLLCILMTAPTAWAIPLAIIVSLVAFTYLFTDKGFDIEALPFKEAWQTFSQRYFSTEDPVEKFTLSAIALHLIEPVIRIFPLIGRVYPFFYATPVIALQMCAATTILGYRCETSLAPKANVASASDTARISRWL